MLTVIGICGHNRVGKDTVASVLCSQAGFTRVALADGVREAFGGLDGPTWEFRKDQDASGSDNRTALKVLGTECRQDVHSMNHWVDHALIKIRYASHYHKPARLRFVVPDVRFPHEPEELSATVRAWGGRYETWTIRRNGCGITTGHASETSVDSIPADRILYNDGSREVLARNVMGMLGEIMAGEIRDAV